MLLSPSNEVKKGLDFADVSVGQVLSPAQGSAYVHRLGRTGRHGRAGRGLLLLHPREEAFLAHLQQEQAVALREAAARCHANEVVDRVLARPWAEDREARAGSRN